MRKPSIKDDVASHTTVARQLETDWDLYDEAIEEWRWVYAKRKETSTGADALVTLARWCNGSTGQRPTSCRAPTPKSLASPSESP